MVDKAHNFDPGAIHTRIPVRAWSYNSDVETVHRTIEDEFYDLENFANIRDFHRRAASYQAWYNILRPNMNKDNKSPWQIVREINPAIPIDLVRLPPLMLDWLGPDHITKEQFLLSGDDVPFLPYYFRGWVRITSTRGRSSSGYSARPVSSPGPSWFRTYEPQEPLSLRRNTLAMSSRHGWDTRRR